MKGNCLEPESFRDVMQDVSGVVHTVGTLIQNTKNPQLSYKAMNRDAAINVAKELNDSVSEGGDKKNFVMLGSAKAPPFLPEYLDRKIEAENYLFNECPNVNAWSLRPGFIYNKEHRGWSIPLLYAVKALAIPQAVVNVTPLKGPLDFLFPASPSSLESVGYYAVEGAMGNLSQDDRIILPETFDSWKQ